MEAVELHLCRGELKAQPGSKATVNAVDNIIESNLETQKLKFSHNCSKSLGPCKMKCW